MIVSKFGYFTVRVVNLSAQYIVFPGKIINKQLLGINQHFPKNFKKVVEEKCASFSLFIRIK